ADATGEGRDAEVQLEWLREQSLTGAVAAARDWLVERIEAKRRQAYDRIRSHVAADFSHLQPSLVKALSSFEVEVRPGRARRGPGFDTATAQILDESAAALAERLSLVHGPSDETQAHQARVAAKRLRYLVEPVAH